VRLHPREESFEVSQGRTVLSTSLNGFVRTDTTDGLFVHQTRMLSCYRWMIDGTGCALFFSRLFTQPNCGVFIAGNCTMVTWTLLWSWINSQRSESVKPAMACLSAQ
jgi:hypothetical protein